MQDLLAAGINVISTINIQHLESLYNIVEQNTGVRVKERIPDEIVPAPTRSLTSTSQPKTCSIGSRRGKSIRSNVSSARWPISSPRRTSSGFGNSR